MKKAHVIKAIVFRCGAFGALVTLALLGLFGSIANAEGSRSLYPADYTTNFPNGDRAWFEWTDDTYYNDLVKRRTLLYVYAEAGEVLFLGSSSQGIESDDVTNTASGDIYVYENKAPVPGKEGNEDDPDAADADFRCSSKAEADSPTPGYIENRVQELAGPKRNPSNPDSSDAGYIPCTHEIQISGIHRVVITGTEGLTPSSTGGGNQHPGKVYNPGSTTTFDTLPEQTAAWDVTVRSNKTSTTDINGRVFTYAFSGNVGSSGRTVHSTLYPVTLDGFRYRAFLRGFDPFGFVLLGSSVGFYDADGVTPLYRDALGDGSGAGGIGGLQGGVTIAPPEFPLFFNPPANSTLSELGIPLVTQRPEVRNVSFTAKSPAQGRNTPIGQGGTFSYEAVNAGEHTYRIIISRNVTNPDFDPTEPTNRVLRGRVGGDGLKTVEWDGTDNAGNNFDAATNYPARIRIHSGEYHFPYGDVENSVEGGPTYTLLNPPGGVCPSIIGGCSGGFYDDRAYRTSNGTHVPTGSTINDSLTGGNPPDVDYSGPDGFNTDSEQRAFGGTSQTGFGNQKGLDLWTYYPSDSGTILFNVVDPAVGYIDLEKSVCNLTAAGGTTCPDSSYASSASGSPGEVLEYRIDYTNRGDAEVKEVKITDQVSGFTPLVTGAYSGDDIKIVCPSLSGSTTTGSTVYATVADPTATSITVDVTSACSITQIPSGHKGSIRFRVRIQ